MSSSDKTYPDFFQVFLPEYCSESLRIPDAFLKCLDHELPKKVILRDPHGNHWAVEVSETKGCSFFQKGWPKFVAKYSLQVGEFLVFKYNGHHVFEVMILEINGCEKKQTDETFSPTGSHAMQEEELSAEEEECRESDCSSSNRRLIGRGANYSVTGYDARRLDERILEFLPSNNPYFVTKLRKARSSELAIPYEVREDFNLKFSESIRLQDPVGRFWDGEIVAWNDGRVWVKNGWKKLCKWNKVTLDDTLICEFLPSEKPICEIIRVQIIRPKKPNFPSV